METLKVSKKLFDCKKEIGRISKDSTNPFFKSKYFDINALLQHVEPILEKHNLLLTQPIIGGAVFSIITDIESGESLHSELELSQQQDPQKKGSEITYYRRYTLQSLLGLQAEDDDANRASGNGAVKEDNQPWLNKTAKGSDELTKAWVNLQKAIKDKRITSVADVRKHYKVSKAVEVEINNELK